MCVLIGKDQKGVIKAGKRSSTERKRDRCEKIVGVGDTGTNGKTKVGVYL